MSGVVIGMTADLAGTLGAIGSGLLVLGLVLGLLFLLVVGVRVTSSLVVERRRRQIAHERAQTEARMQMYTAATLQRMYEAARQARRGR